MLVTQLLRRFSRAPHNSGLQLTCPDTISAPGFSRLSPPRIAITLLLAIASLSIFAQAPPEPPQPSGLPHAVPPVLPFSNPRIHPLAGKVPAPGTPVIFDATGLGSPLLLNHNWRVGIAPGTDPAQPGFDDSAWPTRDAKEALAEVDDSQAEKDEEKDRNKNPDNDQDKDEGKVHINIGEKDSQNSGSQWARSRDKNDPQHKPFVWFRIHVQLPAHHGPLVVLVRVPVSRNAQVSFNGTVGMDLYADGKLITPNGRIGATTETYQQISRIYPIDIPADATSFVLAARVPYSAFGVDAYTGFFSHRTFFLGERDDLSDHLNLWVHAMLFERIPALVDAGLKVLLAFFLLALFYTQKDHPEYLWLGLQMLMVAPLAWVGMTGSMGQLDQLWTAACVFQLLLISAYLYFEFLVAFLALRKRWYIYLLRFSAPMLITLGPLLLAVRNHQKWVAVFLVISILFALLWTLAWVLFVGLTLTIAAIKRNYEAALLLLPLLLSIVGMAELTTTAGTQSWLGTPVQSPLTFQAGPIPIHFSDVADFVGIFVIILIIFVRFLRIHRERERASSELAAARSVQELMIPRESPQTPGFHVDTVYTPATEVGGDFFHIQATGDGGLLVVVGDVAGHGLQAAMNVSMLMGALRRSPQTDPAKLLAGLNEVLVGSESFTTCLAAYFHASGELVIASAGHPPPYLNSQEVDLPGGLPLGVITGIVYEEARLYLHPGDRLLMMSDGVSEARKSNGELFGFDRVRNLSNQSAFFIADAAKEFGQEDDITVLTVHRLAPAVAA
jgi:Stage II sporulation protein E (SpoIIE)